MNLIVDIGNTYTKLAIVNNGKLVHIERWEKVSNEILNEISKKFKPSRTIISAVGLYDKEVYKMFKEKNSVMELDHNTKIPIKNLYKTPETLGLDRLAVAVGAAYLYPKTDSLVIDCGTAITYDFINRNQEYLGGAISPGIRLRFESLYNQTEKLPLVEPDQGYPLLGGSTKECIMSGVLNGVAGEVDGYINRVKEQFPKVKVLITGGDTNFFADKLKNSIFVVQNLVITGLNRILEFNA